MASKYTRLYTPKNHYGDPHYFRIGDRVRSGAVKSHHLADVVTAGLLPIHMETRRVAERMYSAAVAALYPHLGGRENDRRGKRMSVRLVQGDRTDYYVQLVAHGGPDDDEDSLHAALFSFENGRRGYFGKDNRWHPAQQPAHILAQAIESVGGYYV